MRWSARKESEWRWFLAPLVITVFALLVIMTGCVKQFRHDPLYDQDLLQVSPSDSATYLRITIENNRSVDGLDPHFYLVGTGTHSLGVVRGYGGTLTRFVDEAWLGPDNCVQIVAHYVGGENWVSPKTCWRKGEYLDVKLQNIMSTSSAWSHR